MLQHWIRIYTVATPSSSFDTSTGSQIDLLKFTDKYGKELKCLNIYGKYGVWQKARACMQCTIQPEFLTTKAEMQSLYINILCAQHWAVVFIYECPWALIPGTNQDKSIAHWIEILADKMLKWMNTPIHAQDCLPFQRETTPANKNLL